MECGAGERNDSVPTDASSRLVAERPSANPSGCSGRDLRQPAVMLGRPRTPTGCSHEGGSPRCENCGSQRFHRRVVCHSDQKPLLGDGERDHDARRTSVFGDIRDRLRHEEVSPASIACGNRPSTDASTTVGMSEGGRPRRAFSPHGDVPRDRRGAKPHPRARGHRRRLDGMGRAGRQLSDLGPCATNPTSPSSSRSGRANRTQACSGCCRRGW